MNRRPSGDRLETIPSRLLQGEPVALTQALVAIPSVNPDLEEGGTGEAEVASLCARLLSEWGFRVRMDERAPGRPSVLARLGDGSPSLILNGHLDTVGVNGMSIEPFDPVIRDGQLFGRGSCDMKGGIAAILSAARRIALEGGPERGELTVALTADEEYASVGLEGLLADGLSADAAVVCEPTSLAVMPANKGFAWWALAFHGREAHGSRPDEGRDAIRAAGRFLALLDRYETRLGERPPHPLLGAGSIHAGTIRGGTTPPVYPALCELVLEARTLPGQSAEMVGAWLEALRDELQEADPDLDLTLTPSLHRPPGELAADHPLARDLLAACRSEGVPPRTEGMTAWVESAWFLEAGIPALCFGPGSIRKAHTADESVPVAEVEAATSILLRFARRFLSDAG
jgi:acetylornithine deacetylase